MQPKMIHKQFNSGFVHGHQWSNEDSLLNHHFARTKYMYILRVVQKKIVRLVKTFVFFISLHTYKSCRG